ncbi:MAG: hypothetical protein JNM84_22250 [Planctomycetes bacterium]|nr:hypothetical protein [Planctomycetota bacterium]
MRSSAVHAALCAALVLPACGPREPATQGSGPVVERPRERLEVLVGRRGPIVFLAFPKAWGAGYDEAALAERARALGVPTPHAVYEIVAVHTGLSADGAEALAFDPRTVELVLTRREDIVARGRALASLERTAASSSSAPLWTAWSGPLGGLPPESVGRWTYLLDAPTRPEGRDGAPVEGRLEWSGEGAPEPVFLGVWRVEESAFLRHLRMPSSELLRVAEIKHAFRGDARATRRG